MENLRFSYYYTINSLFSFDSIFFILVLYLFSKYLLNGYVFQIQKLVISVLSLNAFYKKILFTEVFNYENC